MAEALDDAGAPAAHAGHHPRALPSGAGRDRGRRSRRTSPVDRSALPAVAQRVAVLTRQRFPDLKVPYHSRWRHFEAGGVDRKARLDAALAGRSAGRHRAGADRPHGGQRAAGRRRRARLGLCRMPAMGTALHPLRRTGGGQLRCFHGRAFFQPTPPTPAAWTPTALAQPGCRRAGRRLPGAPRQPAGGTGTAAPRCCAGWPRPCATAGSNWPGLGRLFDELLASVGGR